MLDLLQDRNDVAHDSMDLFWGVGPLRAASLFDPVQPVKKNRTGGAYGQVVIGASAPQRAEHVIASSADRASVRPNPVPSSRRLGARERPEAREVDVSGNVRSRSLASEHVGRRPHRREIVRRPRPSAWPPRTRRRAPGGGSRGGRPRSSAATMRSQRARRWAWHRVHDEVGSDAVWWCGSCARCRADRGW